MRNPIRPWLSRRRFLAAAGSAVAPLAFLRVRQLAAKESLGGKSLAGAKGSKPFVVAEQGSFAVGGTVISNPGTYDALHPTPAGQTFHGDHAYVQYQIPPDARALPLVMWHGAGQFSEDLGDDA